MWTAAGSSWLLSMRRPGCCRTTVRWDRFGSGRKGCACLLAILPASSSSYSDFLQLTQNSAHARAHFEESLEHLPWCCAVWWLTAVESPIPDSGLKEVLGWDVHALLSCGNLSSCESRCIRIGIAHIFAYENDLGV